MSLARIVCSACSLWLLFVALSGPVAVAAPPEEKRELQARAAFLAGRYQEALDTFVQLYANNPDPVYLRNIARCHQKLLQPRPAIDRFQEYLSKARNLAAEERREIQSYVEEMEALELKQSEEAAKVQPPPAPTPIQIEPEKGATVSQAPELQKPEPQTASPQADLVHVAPTATPGRPWRIAGISTAAAGAGFLAIGLAYGLSARSAADDVSRTFDPGTHSDGQRAATLQWVSYGVGVAALTAGTLMYLHGRKVGRAESGLRASVAVNGAAGGLLVQGSF